MGETENSVNPQNGFCWKTKTFYSLRPPVPLPPPSQPLSVADYTLSLLRSDPTFSPSTDVIIDFATDRRLSYSAFITQIQSLAASLKSEFPSLSKNQVALILAPTSLRIPVLYFSLLSLGVTVSPVNPLSTESELTHVVQLSNPVIAFVSSSSVASKLPSSSLPLGKIVIDSPRFLSMLQKSPPANFAPNDVKQSDPAAILYSSGTTGRIKGVELTHRNFIAILANGTSTKFQKDENAPAPHPVALFPLPLFHVFGFFMMVRAVASGETLVFMERFDFENMLKAVEKHKVTYMPVSPPLVVAMAKSELVNKYDLSSLLVIGCGGAPLGKEVAKSFAARFPNTDIVQGYGLTETGGASTGMIGPSECERYGSAGRLSPNIEAKIVDPETREALPPMQQGELWLRGPMVMKGYVGDKEATAATLDSEGWMKTGDLCYIDNDGYLYIVDRLKELIKYKAYQVPPAELEHYLQSIPEVVDAAVIPYPDEEAGQIPMAYVVRKPGSDINEAQIMDIVARKVSPYKKIRKVAFIDAIPKSPAGKILRRELVKHAISAGSSKL